MSPTCTTSTGPRRRGRRRARTACCPLFGVDPNPSSSVLSSQPLQQVQLNYSITRCLISGAREQHIQMFILPRKWFPSFWSQFSSALSLWVPPKPDMKCSEPLTGQWISRSPAAEFWCLTITGGGALQRAIGVVGWYLGQRWSANWMQRSSVRPSSLWHTHTATAARARPRRAAYTCTGSQSASQSACNASVPLLAHCWRWLAGSRRGGYSGEGGDDATCDIWHFSNWEVRRSSKNVDDDRLILQLVILAAQFGTHHLPLILCDSWPCS